MVQFLMLLSGICWTIVYIEIIRKGLKDKTYGIPLFALALNVTWEGLYTFRDLKSSPIPLQGWINLAWVILDIIIVFTYFNYGSKEFSEHVDKKHFIPWSLLIFIMCFTIQYSFLKEFGNSAPEYSALIQNLIMSVLFINMLVGRKSTEGQSQIISVCKWLGTLAPTIRFGIINGHQLTLVLGIFCSVFDIIYIYYLNSFIKSSVSRSGSTTITHTNSLSTIKS